MVCRCSNSPLMRSSFRWPCVPCSPCMHMSSVFACPSLLPSRPRSPLTHTSITCCFMHTITITPSTLFAPHLLPHLLRSPPLPHPLLISTSTRPPLMLTMSRPRRPPPQRAAPILRSASLSRPLRTPLLHMPALLIRPHTVPQYRPRPPLLYATHLHFSPFRHLHVSVRIPRHPSTPPMLA